MEASIEKLILDNVKLAYFFVHKYSNVSDEDMKQEALYGLTKAALSYDQSKGIKFATYAAKCITNEIFMEFRRRKRHLCCCVSLDEGIPGTEDITIGETIPSDEDVAEEVISRCYVDSVITGLSDRDRMILELTIAGENQKQIGKTIGISQPQVSRRIRTFKRKLRKAQERQ